MSPSPAEHSVQAFQSKNFNMPVGTDAVLMLFALHWAKLCPKIPTCHMWAQASLTNFMKSGFFPFLQKQWTKEGSMVIIMIFLVQTASTTGAASPQEPGWIKPCPSQCQVQHLLCWQLLLGLQSAEGAGEILRMCSQALARGTLSIFNIHSPRHMRLPSHNQVAHNNPLKLLVRIASRNSSIKIGASFLPVSRKSARTVRKS